MTRPVRIQLSRAKGWRMPPNTVKVDRSTRWGNPYRVGDVVDLSLARRWGWTISPEGRLRRAEDAGEAVRLFGYCVAFDEALHPYMREELGGQNLACWCKLGEPCHADVLLLVANR